MATLQDVLNEIDQTARQYDHYWVRPLHGAYIDAHGKLKDTLTSQAAHDKMVAELMVSVVTLGMGVGLGALFGKATFKAIAAEGALEIATRPSTSARATAAFARIQSSPALSHFVSGSYDLVAGKINKATSDQAMKLARDPLRNLTAILPPEKFRIALENYLGEAQTVMGRIAADLNLAGLDAETERTVANDMMASRLIANAPRGPVIGNTATAAKWLELAMYMLIVMRSDYIMMVEHHRTAVFFGGNGAFGITANRVPLPMATTSPNYPPSYQHHVIEDNWHTTHSLTASVGHQQPGDILRKRVDELHVELNVDRGRPFYRGRSDRDELQRAEALYKDIMSTRLETI